MRGTGIGIYDFDKGDLRYIKRNSLYVISNEEPVNLDDLIKGKQYMIVLHNKKGEELYEFKGSFGGNYNFKSIDGKAVVSIDRNNSSGYVIYEKVFKVNELSKMLNTWNFTMHIGNSSYRNLIGIQMNGSITCDKRIFKRD